MLVALKFNLKGGQFYKQIGNFGYFNKLRIRVMQGFKNYFIAGPQNKNFQNKVAYNRRSHRKKIKKFKMLKKISIGKFYKG